MRNMTLEESREAGRQLKRLGRLNLRELTAINDRNARRCPDPVVLASALAKLGAP